MSSQNRRVWIWGAILKAIRFLEFEETAFDLTPNSCCDASHRGINALGLSKVAIGLCFFFSYLRTFMFHVDLLTGRFLIIPFDTDRPGGVCPGGCC